MRRITALVLLSMMATLLALVPPLPMQNEAEAQANAQADWHDPGHTIAVNRGGEGVALAVKNNGNMYIRRVTPGGTFGRWTELGRGNWASGEVAIDDSGRVEIIAVKLSGAMYTRSWTGSGVWGPWSAQGAATWDINAQPSISTSGKRITLAAVKADGRLYTRERNVTGNVKWGSWAKHGLSGWSQVDIDMSTNGTAWLIGTKADGRLYTRAKSGNAWGGWGRHGASTWDATTAPSIAARNGSVVYGAVKTDGRLYTRAKGAGWAGYVRHGRADWTGVSVDMSSSGVIGLAATKDFGRLYTRVNNGVSWGGWQAHGKDTWSITADPSISVGDGQTHVLAAKASGALYTRSRVGAAWAGFISHGPDWDGGMSGSTPPPTGDQKAQINSYLRALSYDAKAETGELPAGATGKAETGAPVVDAPEPTSNPNVVIQCTSRDFNLKKNFSEVVLLQPTDGVVWPGALVRGNSSLRDGLPEPIAFERGPVRLRVDLPGIGDNGTFEVTSPDNGRVGAALDRSLDWWNNNAFVDGYRNPANTSSERTYAHSSEQLGIEANLNVSWATGKFAGAMQVDTSSESVVVTQTYQQVFYTVSMATPNSPADFFPDGTSAATVRAAMDGPDAPAYVSSVSYGRILMVRMESSRETTHVGAQAALDWAIAGAKVEADIDVEYDQTLSNSTVRVVAIGGDPAEANKLLVGDEYKDLAKIVQGDNAYYQKNNPGVPVSYQVRYVKDNSLAKMGFTTDYTSTECIQQVVSDRITVRIVRFRAIEDCDAGGNYGDFFFRARVLAGYVNTPPDVGSTLDHEAQLWGGGLNATHRDSYVNVPKLYHFDLARRNNPKPPKFIVFFQAWEDDGVAAPSYDSRMNGRVTLSSHTYDVATKTWDHPPQPLTGLGGTYPRAYIARIGSPGSGCVVDLHYKVYFDGVEIEQG